MHDRLVNMGFDEVEAAKYVEPKEQPTLFTEKSVPQQLTWMLREAPQLYGLPEEIRSQVTVTTNDTGGYEVTFKTVLSAEAEAKLVEAMPQSDREAVRRSLAARREQILVKPEPKPSIMRVPQLCVWVDGELEPVNDEHFLTPDSWSLLDYPAELSEAEFRIEERADMYLIDVQGKRLVEKYLGSQAAFGFEDVPTNVTDLALSRQLEKVAEAARHPAGGPAGIHPQDDWLAGEQPQAECPHAAPRSLRAGEGAAGEDRGLPAEGIQFRLPTPALW